jgi:hypothetical protein
MKCKKTVRNAKVGDKCPHCGVTWDVEKMEDGRYRDADGNVTRTPPRGKAGIVGSIVGVIVFLLIAGLKIARVTSLFRS